jgi:hypothetical protein
MAKGRKTGGRKAKPLADRLRALSLVDPITGCWIWQASKNRQGYGKFQLPQPENRTVGAHRASYQTFRGEIPAGLQIDHLCRKPACINPDHMEVVTPRENTLRGTCQSAKNARKVVCACGHEFSASKIGRKRRYCLVCIQNRRKRRMAQWTPEQKQAAVTARKAYRNARYAALSSTERTAFNKRYRKQLTSHMGSTPAYPLSPCPELPSHHEWKDVTVETESAVVTYGQVVQPPQEP